MKKSETKRTTKQQIAAVISKLKKQMSPEEYLRQERKLAIDSQDWEGLKEIDKKLFPKETEYRRKQRREEEAMERRVTNFKIESQPEGFKDFWKVYDVTDQWQIKKVFKIMFDWPELFDYKEQHEFMKHCMTFGWSMERLEEIRAYAVDACKFAWNGYVEDMVDSKGGKKHKVSSFVED